MGRPRKTRSEANDASELTGRITPDQFLQLIGGYADTTGTNIYINRLSPQIDRRLVNIQTKYIEKLTPPFFNSWDYVLKMHGGGKYQVFFSDGKLSDARVANTIVEFPIVDHEPILNASELVRGTPENEQLIQRWIAQGKVIQTEEGRIVNAPQGGGVTAIDSKSVLQFAEKQIEAARTQRDHSSTDSSKIVEVMAEGAKKMVETAIEVNRPMGVSEIATIASALRPGDNSAVMMQMFTAMLAQTQQQNQQMMQLFMQQQQQPKENPDVFTMIDRLTEKFGIAVPRKESSATDSLVQLAKPLLPVAALWIMTKIPAGKKEEPQQQQRPRRIAATDNAEAKEPSAPQRSQQEQTLYDQTKQFAMLVAHGLANNKAGWALAERIDYDFGRDVYNGIASLGKDTIINTIVVIPEAAAQLTRDRAKLEVFIDEFLHCFDEQDAEESNAVAESA